MKKHMMSLLRCSKLQLTKEGTSVILINHKATIT